MPLKIILMPTIYASTENLVRFQFGCGIDVFSRPVCNAGMLMGCSGIKMHVMRSAELLLAPEFQPSRELE